MRFKGWENFNPAMHRAEQTTEKKRKYRNTPTEIDGVTFASMREANRYLHLREMQGNKKIDRLVLQPRFPLSVKDQSDIMHIVGTYIADFSYYRDGAKIVEDAKGIRTELYKWKKKHVEAEYGIEIIEV